MTDSFVSRPPYVPLRVCFSETGRRGKDIEDLTIEDLTMPLQQASNWQHSPPGSSASPSDASISSPRPMTRRLASVRRSTTQIVRDKVLEIARDTDEQVENYSGEKQATHINPWPWYPLMEHNSLGCYSRWESINGICLIFCATVTPYETAFLPLRFDVLFVINRIVDTVFFIDMCLQFFLVVPDTRLERPVRYPPRIWTNYMSGWFIIDFLSILPIDLIEFVTHQTEIQNMGDKYATKGFENKMKIIRLLRLTRLLKVGRFAKMVEKWENQLAWSYAVVSLLRFFMMIILCCHWMACVWGAIAFRFAPDTFEDEEDSNTWLLAMVADKGLDPRWCSNHVFIYQMSLYWAIVTLTSIGYGDITPQNRLELTIAPLCVFIMSGIWAYVIGAVCGVVSTLQPHEVNFKRTMDDLNWLINDHSVPGDFAGQLRRYFHEARDISRQHMEHSVIEHMSPMLQGKFAMCMHEKSVRKVWYLKDMNREVIIWAARHMTTRVFAPNEEVLNERTLYIVSKGIAALSGKILSRGDVWGEDMLLHNHILRNPANVRSLSYLCVVMLHVADLVDIVVGFPAARKRLRWAQVRIAIHRGLVKIAEVIKYLGEKYPTFDYSVISEDKKKNLLCEILAGTVNSSGADIPFFEEDYLDAPHEPASAATFTLPKHASFHSTGTVSKRQAPMPIDEGDLFEEMTKTKTDGLFMTKMPSLAPGGPRHSVTIATTLDTAPAETDPFISSGTSQIAGVANKEIMQMLGNLETSIGELKDDIGKLDRKVDHVARRTDRLARSAHRVDDLPTEDSRTKQLTQETCSPKHYQLRAETLLSSKSAKVFKNSVQSGHALRQSIQSGAEAAIGSVKSRLHVGHSHETVAGETSIVKSGLQMPTGSPTHDHASPAHHHHRLAASLQASPKSAPSGHSNRARLLRVNSIGL